MKRFGVLLAVLALVLGFGAALHAATNPPTNLKKVGDHWYSYENEANWPVYRAIFSN